MKIHFANTEEEITFFKDVKSEVLANVIYYANYFNIETKKPFGSHKNNIKYYQDHINSLQAFIDQNIEFFHYHKTGAICFDEQYFTRASTNLRLFPQDAFYYTDDAFTTTHDSLLATLMANEKLIIQLKLEIDTLIQKQNRFGRTHLCAP